MNKFIEELIELMKKHSVKSIEALDKNFIISTEDKPKCINACIKYNPKEE